MDKINIPNFSEYSNIEFTTKLNRESIIKNKTINQKVKLNTAGHTVAHKIEKCAFIAGLSIENPCSFEINDCYITDLEISGSGNSTINLLNTTTDHLKITYDAGFHQFLINVKGESLDQQGLSSSKIGSITFRGLGQGNLDLRIENSFISNMNLIGSANAQTTIILRGCRVGEAGLKSINLEGKINQLNILDNSEVFGEISLVKSHGSILKIFNSIAQNKITFSSGSSNFFHCANASLASEIEASAESNFNLQIEGGNTNSVCISGASSLQSVLITSDGTNRPRFNKLSFLNSLINQGVNFKIDNSLIKEFDISYFTNEGSLKIQNTTISNAVTINNTELGVAEFQNVSLNEKLKFKLLNSTVTESKFFTVNWMANHKLLEEYPKETLNKNDNIQYFLTLKESYRQLKAISQAGLNRFDALNFQRHEQRIQKEIFWLKRQIWDFLLLKTNEIFNNYGVSYTKPFRWLFAIHFIWFSVMLLIGKPFDYTFFFISGNEVDWSLTMPAISDYFKTLFPIHSFDYLGDSKGWPIIIDLLMRITSGYFIYYFLSATRKFHLN